jgi:hypothetical protein
MSRHQRGFTAAFVDDVQSQGRLTFGLKEIASAGGPSGEALEKALQRQRALGRIQRISRKSDVFVIVPPEFRTLGVPPVEWWIDDVMGHLRLPYYGGLLTAARWHGSSHFAVMETQIVVPVNRRPITVGRTRVRFFASAKIAATPVEKRTNVWGGVRVSTPAATLLDLIQYRQGGMDRVALIAADLIPRIAADALLAALDAAGSVPSAQRLGFVFEQLGAKGLADAAARWLGGKPHRAVDLEPGGGAPWEHSRRWQVRVNSTLEALA